MKIKLLATIVLAVIASLSIAGCTVGLPSTSSPTPTPTATPTATPTPPTHYSSYFNKAFEGVTGIMDRPFTKSTNERGNDVYKGVARNTSLPQNMGMTLVVELTKSQAESKQLFDQYVAQKQNEGFVVRSDWVAQWKSGGAYKDAWIGVNSDQRQFYVMYLNNPEVNSWELITEAST